jgi:hypothetical protein
MRVIGRRRVLGALPGGIAVASGGALLVAKTTTTARAAGVMPNPGEPGPIEKAQVVVVGPRRRRRRCWWSRGRRVCAWR